MFCRPKPSNVVSFALVSLLLPVLALVFLSTGPHQISTVLLWIMPFWMVVFGDFLGTCKPSPASKQLSEQLYHLLLFCLAAIQIANIYLLLEMSSALRWDSTLQIITNLTHLLAIKVIIGTTSSFCGIVVAHEFIHKPGQLSIFTGRLLLILVCYEHFYTEHLRGHHRHVGTDNDPATAHYGESFSAFWRRTVIKQFSNAWNLENQRLHSIASKSLKRLQHRVLQGLVIELLLLATIASVFGTTALVAFLIQAFAAVRKLEAVNYIEHWGLERSTGLHKEILSWDTNSWFTTHSLIGLSRHNDHHRNAGKPFQQLQHCEHSPQLPYGYFASIFLCTLYNKKFQHLATVELQSKQLGPFQPSNTSNPGD